jgi:[ribosomal protein S5]-alanine N-acetyltransferase
MTTLRAEPMLRTERLVMRALTPGDADAFIALAGDFAVARMTSDIAHPLDVVKALAWLSPSNGEARFAITLDGRMIGSSGYFRRTSDTAELGFWLGHAWWGRGFATEAARAVARHGFEADGLAAFTSSHFVDNPASARVLAKLGFAHSGYGRIWSLARGSDIDAVLLELTRARAAETLEITAPAPQSRQSRWSALIERVRGA